MQPSEEIMQFLKDNPTFYLATVEGYLPRVRPMGFAMWYKDHLCLGIGKHKAAYKQLLDNTNLELCVATGEETFLRIQGTVNFDRSPETYAAVYEAMPDLKEAYKADSGKHLALIYLDHISAVLFDRQDEGKVLAKF